MNTEVDVCLLFILLFIMLFNTELALVKECVCVSISIDIPKACNIRESKSTATREYTTLDMNNNPTQLSHQGLRGCTLFCACLMSFRISGGGLGRCRGVAAQVAFGKAKFVTGFSRRVKGQAQGLEPGAFKLWVH